MDKIRTCYIIPLIEHVAATEEYGARFTTSRIMHITRQVIRMIQVQGLDRFDFSNEDEAKRYIVLRTSALLRSKRKFIRFRQVLHHFPESVISVDDTRSRGHTILMNHIHAVQNPTSRTIVEYFTNNKFRFVSIREKCIVSNDRALSFIDRFLRDLWKKDVKV